MTPDRRAPDPMKLPDWLWPMLAAALLGTGAARVTLSGKEDAAAHASDMSDVRRDHTADVSRLQGQRDQDAIRDSARHADVMRVLIDLQRRMPR